MPFALTQKRNPLALNGLIAFVAVLLAISPFLRRYLRDRDWNNRVDNLAGFYESRGSMTKSEYWRMANIGTDIVNNGGRIGNPQLNSVLSFSSAVKSKSPTDESTLTTALGQLISVKEFDRTQAAQVSRFVDQELIRPHSPLVQILISKIGCRVGSAKAKEHLQTLTQDQNPQVARIARTLESRIANGKRP